MKGSVIASTLPASHGDKREQLIFEAVQRRDIPTLNWSPLISKHGPYTAEIYVTNDTLRIGDDTDSFRATVSQRTAQKIVDDLGLVMPTTKISDMIYAQAKHKLMPITRPWYADYTMANTARMLQQSARVDKEIAGRSGLVADVGKDWIITRKLWDWQKAHPGGGIKSAIYGWRGGGANKMPAAPGVAKVIQPLALAHWVDHVDYSQTLRLVGRHVWVCSTEWGDCKMIDIEKVLQTPELAPLISYEGALPVYRHPGLPGAGKQPPLPPPGPQPTPPPSKLPPNPGTTPGQKKEPPLPDIAVASLSSFEEMVVFGCSGLVGYWLVNQLLESDR